MTNDEDAARHVLFEHGGHPVEILARKRYVLWQTPVFRQQSSVPRDSPQR